MQALGGVGRVKNLPLDYTVGIRTLTHLPSNHYQVRLCTLWLEVGYWDRQHSQIMFWWENKTAFFLCTASTRSLKVLKSSPSSEWNGEQGKGTFQDSDECSLSSSTQSSSCHTTESIQEPKNSSPEKHVQSCASDFSNALVKESDILSDDDDDDYQSLKKGSPTKDIEIQFQQLKISEEPSTDSERDQAAENKEGDRFKTGDHPKLVRGHFCPVKRKVNSTKRNRGTLTAMQERHQSLDSHSDAANLDLNSILEREFSVQSLTSVVNEDCFYEAVERHGKS